MGRSTQASYRKREETGYRSEIEENKQAEMNSGKGKRGGESAQGGKGYGKKGRGGKPRKSPYDADDML